MYNCLVKKGVTLDFTLPENFNTGILILEGSARINDAEIAPVDNFCLFDNDGTEIKVEALEDAMFIVLSGEPLNEPIAAYGPFVMNTFEEIHQAKRDFGNGKFGYLE